MKIVCVQIVRLSFRVGFLECFENFSQAEEASGLIHPECFWGPRAFPKPLFSPRGGELNMCRNFGCLLCVAAVLAVCGLARADYISTVQTDNPVVFYPLKRRGRDGGQPGQRDQFGGRRGQRHV